MDSEELVNRLTEKLHQFRVPKDINWLFALLDKMIADYDRRYQKQKEYVQKNRKKIYQYNTQRRRQKRLSNGPKVPTSVH